MKNTRTQLLFYERDWKMVSKEITDVFRRRGGAKVSTAFSERQDKLNRFSVLLNAFPLASPQLA